MVTHFFRTLGMRPATRRTYEERLIAYTDRLDGAASPYTHEQPKSAFLLTVDTSYQEFAKWWRIRGRQDPVDAQGRAWSERTFERYILPLMKTARSTTTARKCAFLAKPDDTPSDYPEPVIVKSRAIGRTGRTTLFKLNARRHWLHVWKLGDLDRPYAEKADRLVFRGMPTNRWPKLETSSIAEKLRRATNMAKRSQRFALYRRLAEGLNDRPEMDLGFVSFGDAPPAVPSVAFFTKDAPVGYVDSMTIEAQLQSKLMLSLEGNDVASGLRWMMNSNSVVVAPPPTRETWFLEGRLEPWRHFVPTAPDLSDLEEVVEWCFAHPKRCVEINAEAKQYVKQFSNRVTENSLLKSVLDLYAQRVRIELPASSPLYGDYRAANLSRSET